MKLILLVLSLFSTILSYGQSKDTLSSVTVTGFTRETRGKPFRLEVTKNTKIFDKITGQEISYEDYQKMIKKDPLGHCAVPIYDEFGKASSFFLRETTKEEQEKKIFKMNYDPTTAVKIGEVLPSFVITAINGKVYASKDLKDKTVVLAFFTTLNFFQSPYFKLDEYKKIIQDFSSSNFIFITIFNENIEEEAAMISDSLNSPVVSEGRGFMQRLGISGSSTKTFMIIDKMGKVHNYAPSMPNLEDLTKILKDIPK